MSNHILITLFATAGLATLALTGCSTDALPGSGTTGSAAPAPTAAGGSFTIPKDCPSSAEVGASLGVPAPPAPTKTATSDSLTCVYLSPTQDGVIVDIEPSHGATPATIEAGLKSNATTGEEFASVSGIGDAAFSLSKGGSVVGLYVLKGSSQIDIAGGNSLNGLEALARKLLGP